MGAYGDRTAYDNAAHSIWLCKEIIAPVLKEVVGEYRDFSVSEIVEMIDPDIRADQIISDYHAQDRGTESTPPTEKILRYDARFTDRRREEGGKIYGAT